MVFNMKLLDSGQTELEVLYRVLWPPGVEKIGEHASTARRKC
jgi:hypothetical protein